MKSMMVAVMAVMIGLSTGCAQIEYLQNPANYRVSELDGSRMYCHGDYRDNSTICMGWQSQEQIVQAAEAWAEAKAEAKRESARALASRNAAYQQALVVREERRIAEEKAAKLQAIEDKKQAIRKEKRWKAEEIANAKEQAEYDRAIEKAQAERDRYARAQAAILEAAKIERRDHPEIGAARDWARTKARYAQQQAEEDVYRAKHNGRSEDEDQAKVMETLNRELILNEKFRQERERR